MLAEPMSFPKSTPNVTRWCMLVVSVASFAAAIYALCWLVQAEYTGTAGYYPDVAVPVTERVTRAREPDKFKVAELQGVFQLILPGSVAVAAFYFYRRLST